MTEAILWIALVVLAFVVVYVILDEYVLYKEDRDRRSNKFDDGMH